ncbi:MAG: ATP-binding protein [Chloroflexota bacterium]
MKRSTFETSRALEYFTEKELRAQIGHGPESWPVAILRELIDNSLDACEGADVVPEIAVTTTGNDTFVVTDNGPGIPAEVITRSLDYLVRVSTKSYYVSPTRGAMGNALKVIWAAPFVMAGAGAIEIVAQGLHHHIQISLDRIAQKPAISHTTEPSPVKSGTSAKITWADSARLLRSPKWDSCNVPPTASQLIEGFAAFNPHATFILDGKRFPSTGTTTKWSPSQPTSAHWYTAETLRDLVAAYITMERTGGPQKTVREFVSEFRGLSATGKQKTVTEGWTGKHLHDFVADGDVGCFFVEMLLKRMQKASRAPAPKALGAIGRDHLTAWMIHNGVAPESIRYQQKVGIDTMPYVLEVAFGVNAQDSGRQIVTGLNWSPVIGGGADVTLAEAVAEARLDLHDPVTLLVHIARPRFGFADRGKTRVTSMSEDINAAVASAVKNVTKAWKQAKRSADRKDRVSKDQLAKLRHKPSRVTIREVAFDVMEDAYNKASSNGKYYAVARQIMYAARPEILAECDAEEFDDSYFTQTLLKDYLEEYEPDWKVVWDARGHLIEPHTRAKVSLGGVGVQSYMEEWHEEISMETPEIKSAIGTHGPANRFGSVLFIEKEGFAEILTHAGIGTRYDMAIMSTKGIPTKAACDLIEAMHDQDVRIFVLRDFDYAGFKIVRTLREGSRLSSGSPVIDLGLRLEDIKSLESEPVSYGTYIDPRDYLIDLCDATEGEAKFLRSGGTHECWTGRRVEINAMTSDQLIAWLERKFAEHGVKKVVPASETIERAYKRAVFLKRMREKIEELEEEIDQDDLDIPNGLASRVEALLKKRPALSWDEVVWQLAKEEQ